MKYFIYTLMFLSIALLVFNIFHLNFDHLFDKESSTALIGALASLCVFILMLILLVSRAIKQKSEENS